MPKEQRMPQDQLKRSSKREGRNTNIFVPDELYELLSFFADELISKPHLWVVVAYAVKETLIPLKKEYEQAVIEDNNGLLFEINKKIVKVSEKYG